VAIVHLAPRDLTHSCCPRGGWGARMLIGLPAPPRQPSVLEAAATAGGAGSDFSRRLGQNWIGIRALSAAELRPWMVGLGPAHLREGFAHEARRARCPSVRGDVGGILAKSVSNSVQKTGGRMSD
jgi:hypothetical protein